MMTKEASHKRAALLLIWLKDSKLIGFDPIEISLAFAKEFKFLTSVQLSSTFEGVFTNQRLTVKIGLRIYEFKRKFRKVNKIVYTLVEWNTKANWPA